MSYKWSIYITLPKNRSKDGNLDFSAYTDEDSPERVFHHSCKCHGEGTGGDWDKHYGNTPTGTAMGCTMGPGSPEESYGPYRRINFTTPMTGNIEKAYKKRDGLEIHGGRDQNKLMITHGCIRVFDKDIKIITDYIDDHCKSKGKITIVEE